MGLVDVQDEVVRALANVLAEMAADLLLKVVLLFVGLEGTGIHPRKAQRTGNKKRIKVRLS
jgi:hypothetical protein